MSYASAVTNGAGMRLLCGGGIDPSGTKIEESGTRIDVWHIEVEQWHPSRPTTHHGQPGRIYNHRPVLGDLLASKFEVLARYLIREAYDLREPVELFVGSRVKQIDIGGKSYILSCGKIFSRGSDKK